MPTRQIVFSDDPLLRKKSRRVKRISPATQQLIDDMVETMYEANGIGLAAIQVGVPERVIVVQLPEDEEKPESSKLYVVVNPQLARRSREIEEGVEGCLSVPGLVGEVPRHSTVTVKGLDLHGRAVRIKADELLARVFQHEIDHCDGTLFIDRVEDPEKILDKVRHGGAIFLGPESPESLGDYVAGPNHVLPTSGTARFFSPLGVYDFIKRSSILKISPHGLERLGPKAMHLARMEGLHAHARALDIRIKK